MSRVQVCPRCGGALAGSRNCSKCGSGKLFTAVAQEAAEARRDLPGERWHQTSEGRIVIAALLALGLCYGLLQLGMAILRAVGKENVSGELSPGFGLALFLTLQGFALLPAGILAGAGQRRGILLGGLVGIFSGLLFISGMLSRVLTGLVQPYSQQLLTPGTPVYELTLYSLPVLHTVCGAIGGIVGGAIWKPYPDLALPFLSPQKRLALRREAAKATPLFRWEGPVAWVHVILGTGIAILGTVHTPRIIDFVLSASEQKLAITTQLEDQVAYGEVFALFILLGGVIAGAGSPNGLKQGVVAAMGLGFLMAGIFWKGPNAPSVIYPVLCAVFLAPVGGWFGSELLPPTFRFQRQRRKDLY